MAVGGGISAFVDISAVKQGVVLAVGGYDAVKRGAFPHRLPHHFPVLHSAPVVGESDAAAFERGEIHRLHSLSSECYARVGEDLDHSVPVYYALLDGNVLFCVRRRLEVGHSAHGGVASACGRTAAGKDGLLVGVAGLAEMHVKVHKAGTHSET